MGEWVSESRRLRTSLSANSKEKRERERKKDNKTNAVWFFVIVLENWYEKANDMNDCAEQFIQGVNHKSIKMK